MEDVILYNDLEKVEKIVEDALVIYRYLLQNKWKPNCVLIFAVS